MPAKPIPKELKAAYERALQDHDVDGVLRAADALQQLGDSRGGEAWLRQAWRTFPDESRIAIRLLEIYLRYRAWGDFDEVSADALEKHADSVDLHYSVGCGHETRGRWEAAAASFGRAADLAPAEIEARLRQVRSLRILGAQAAAQKALKQAIKQHPREASFHAQMGYICIERQKTADAVKWFEKALERQPDWQQYMDDLAGALMLCERWDEAARAAIQSLDLRKKNERAWTVFAIAHGKLGDDERAEQGYKNAIRAAKDASRAKGNFGLFLAKKPDRILEAIRMLKAACAAHPDWAEARSALDTLLAS